MVHFPKLDVAGSSPVSRSMFSIVYKSGTLTSITSFNPQSLEAQGLIPVEPDCPHRFADDEDSVGRTRYDFARLTSEVTRYRRGAELFDL